MHQMLWLYAQFAERLQELATAKSVERKWELAKNATHHLTKNSWKQAKKEAKKIKSANELKSATLKQADEVKEEKVEKKASTKQTSKAPAKKSTTAEKKPAEKSASTKKSTASTKKASK